MKLLIAYDGSESAEAAIDDLVAAGLPQEGEADVISVAEAWLPPAEAVDVPAYCRSTYVESIVRTQRERGEKVLSEASIRAKHAEARVRVALPGWQVRSKAVWGSAALSILSAAEELDADLIVVGSHGHSGLNRLILGSTSHTVLTEARCSVRVARGKVEVDPGPARLLIGFDGSKGSFAAVNAAADRVWRPGTEVKLVAATEPLVPSAIGRFLPPVTSAVEEINLLEDSWLVDISKGAVERLQDAGLSASFQMRPGNPKHVLAKEAESWRADCIFLGANAWGGRLSRILLGSTASAVSARAHCSVEAVRLKGNASASFTLDADNHNGKFKTETTLGK